MSLLFYVPDYVEPGEPPPTGGIDSYTKLMMHMDGDQSASQHVITAGGASRLEYQTTGKWDSSIYFDQQQNISVGVHSDFNFGTGDFTFECWINRWSVNGDYTLFSGDNQGNTLIIYSIKASDSLRVYAGSTSYQDFSHVWGGGWHHVAISRSSGVIRAFVDGTQIGSNWSNSDSVNMSNGVMVGQTIDALSWYPMRGNIDEIRISNVARYISNFSVETEPFTSDSNTKFLYHCGGNVAEAHSIHQWGYPQTKATPTKWDGALYFDGSNDYINVPNHADWDFAGGDFTIDFWINFQTLPVASTSYIINHRVGDTRQHVLALGTANQLWWFAKSDLSGLDFAVTRTLAVVQDTWHHLALIREGNDFKMYFDGQQQGAADTDTNDWANFGVFNIGRHITGFGYLTDALMDEFRISKGIARWTSNFTPETGPYTTPA